MSRPFDYDPVTGRTRTWHWDPVAEVGHIVSSMDVEPLLDLNRFQYNSFDERSRWGNAPMHKVASLSAVQYGMLLAAGVMHDQKALAKWLDDSAVAKLRTRPGGLSKVTR